MLVYWLLFSVLALGALLNQDQNLERRRWLLVLCGSIPSALMIGLRWHVGPDWNSYYDIFSYTKLLSFAQMLHRGDWGFASLLWLLHRENAPFWLLNLICGTIFVIGLTAFCRRQPNPWLAYLVAFPYLVIVVGLSGIRQSAALGFLFLALNEFERGKLIRFSILLILAATMHSSAIVMLPICLLSYTRNNLQRVVLLALAALFASHFLSDQFMVYAHRYSSTTIQSSGAVTRLAMNAWPGLLFILFSDRLEWNENQRKLWRNFSILTFAMGLALLVAPSSTAVDRLLLYLFPLQLVVLSRIPGVFGGERSGTVLLTLAVIGYAASVQAVYLLTGVSASGYLPYQTIFTS